MKKKKVVKNTPARLPISFTCLVYLMMDRFNASQLAWGIAGTIMAFIWVACIIAVSKQEMVDLFESETDQPSKPYRSNWEERMANIRK